jgi:hypothetical protein
MTQNLSKVGNPVQPKPIRIRLLSQLTRLQTQPRTRTSSDKTPKSIIATITDIPHNTSYRPSGRLLTLLLAIASYHGSGS